MCPAVVCAVALAAFMLLLVGRWVKLRTLPPTYLASSIVQGTSLRLPVEVIERVADFLFQVQPNADGGGVILSVKPQWSDISGFMEASPELHTMGYIRWLTAIIVRHPDDWQILLRHSHLVRQLQCADGVLTSTRRQTVFERFSHLYALAIDAHSDVTHDEQNHVACRDLFLSLPASLRRLEITRAHAPGINIIAAVKEYCPNLEMLSLGRCTVFNSPTICRFWQTFPLDHDLYMSIEDADSYAYSLAQELAPLRCLQSLRLGLYLVPSTTILAHRLYHKRNVAAPELIEWQHAVPLAALPEGAIPNDATLPNQVPASTDQLTSILYQTDPWEEFGSENMCGLCVESLSQVGGDAETRANAILKNLLPNLTNVQWMAWLSPGHLGVNVHEL